MVHSTIVRSVAVLLLLTAIPAQKTWIVDGTGGGNFTTLASAIKAASDGDTISIRAGSYGALITDKALRILGDAKVTVATIKVTDLAAGKRLVLANIAAGSFGSGHVTISNNKGSVILDRVTAGPIQISTCPHVAIHKSSFSGIPFGGGSSASNSNISMTEVSIQSSNATGIRVTGCLLDCCNVRVTGGGAYQCFGIPSDGIVLLASALTLAGARTTISSGSTSCQLTSASAIHADRDSSILMDPAVVLLSHRAKNVFGPITPVIRPVGVVLVQAGAPGTSLTTDVIAPSGSTVFLFGSGPAAPVFLPFGTVWINIAPSVLIDSGVVDSSGHRVKKFPLGTFFARGQALTFQAGVVHKSILTVSTPDTVVLH
jgi:hypothetical protein